MYIIEIAFHHLELENINGTASKSLNANHLISNRISFVYTVLYLKWFVDNLIPLLLLLVWATGCWQSTKNGMRGVETFDLFWEEPKLVNQFGLKMYCVGSGAPHHNIWSGVQSSECLLHSAGAIKDFDKKL